MSIEIVIFAAQELRIIAAFPADYFNGLGKPII